MVLINKYLYTVYFAEPPSDAPTTGRDTYGRQVLRMYFTALKFIGDYLTLGRFYARASSVEVQKLLDDAFPDLGNFMLQYRLDGDNIPRPHGANIDYAHFGRNLGVLGGIDWPAMYRIAELEEKRRGRTMRFVDRPKCLHLSFNIFILDQIGLNFTKIILCHQVVLVKLQATISILSW